MKPSLKVFIMTVISFVITTISTLANFNAWYVVLVTVVFAGEYALKNYWFPSVSGEGQLMWQDLVSGLLLALFMGIDSYAAQLILGITFSATALWAAVAGAFVGYFTKTIPQGVKTARLAPKNVDRKLPV